MARFGRAFSSAFGSGFGNKQYTRLSPGGTPMAKYWSIGDPAGVKTPATGPSFQAAWAADCTKAIMPGDWV